MLRSSDSQLKLRLVMQVQKYRTLRALIPTYGERRFAAMLGFHALGLTTKKPAFPMIVEIVLTSDANLQAISSLAGADSDTVLALVKGLANPDRKVRCRAALALCYFPQFLAVSAPALTRALKDSAPEVRTQASMSLANLSQNPDPTIRSIAAQALQNVATGAREQR